MTFLSNLFMIIIMLVFPIILAWGIVPGHILYHHYHFHLVMNGADKHDDDINIFCDGMFVSYLVLFIISTICDIIYFVGCRKLAFINYLTDNHSTLCTFIKYAFEQHPFWTKVYLGYVILVVWFGIKTHKEDVDTMKKRLEGN